jgi:hypothetical protein
MEIEVKDIIKLPDGKHTGTITEVKYREEPYAYTDIYIQEDKTELTLKYGCPTDISENTKLGKLIAQFTPLEAKKKIDPEKILKNKKVSFMTITEETERGTFSRIVDNSIRNEE